MPSVHAAANAAAPGSAPGSAPTLNRGQVVSAVRHAQHPHPQGKTRGSDSVDFSDPAVLELLQGAPGLLNQTKSDRARIDLSLLIPAPVEEPAPTEPEGSETPTDTPAETPTDPTTPTEPIVVNLQPIGSILDTIG